MSSDYEVDGIEIKKSNIEELCEINKHLYTKLTKIHRFINTLVHNINFIITKTFLNLSVYNICSK